MLALNPHASQWELPLSYANSYPCFLRKDVEEVVCGHPNETGRSWAVLPWNELAERMIPFPCFLQSLFLETVSIYVDNGMDFSSDQQLLGDTGEIDSHIKKTTNWDLCSSSRCPQIRFLVKQLEEYIRIWVSSLLSFFFFFEGAWIDEGEISIIRNNTKGGITKVVQ